MIKRKLALILVALMVLQVFSLTVSADAVKLSADTSALTRDSIQFVPQKAGDLLVDNLNLPKQGANGSVISWSSEPSGIIDENGKLTRPDEDTTVTLTATLTNEADTDTVSFDFNVAGKENRAYGMPLVKQSIYYDDFEDGVLDTNHVTVASGVTEENGALHFVRGASGSTKATVFLYEDQSSATGQFVTEFVLSRKYGGRYAKEGMLSAQFVGNELASIITWWDPYNNIVAMQSSKTEGGPRTTNPDSKQLTAINGGEKLKVTLYFDTATKQIMFWLNNQYAGSGYFCGNASDLQNIYFYNDSQPADVRMEEFHFYEADYALTGGLAVDSDLLNLEANKFLKAPLIGNYLIDSLNLPTVGENGSEIEWTSTHPTIISEDGWVTRGTSDAEVTLTATVTNGDASATKVFTFIVPGKETEVSDMPTMGDMLFYDDFNDGAVDEKIVLTAGEGTAEESDGALRLAKTQAQGTTSATIYLKEDKTAMTGRFAVDFILKRKNIAATASVGIYGNNMGLGGLNSLIVWWDKNTNLINLGYGDTPTSGRINHTDNRISALNAQETLKVTVYFDTERNQVTYWLNQQFAGNGYSCGAEGVSCIEFYNETTAFDLEIDDFRCYEASLVGDADERVAEELAALTETALLKAPLVDGKLIDSLNLYTVGNSGSNILWSSTNPAVIAENGDVFRTAESEEVTVTATVSYMGEGTQTKSFTFNVAGLADEPAGMPVLTGLPYMDNFNDGIVNENHIVLADGSGMARESGGAISLIKPAATGTTSATVYLTEDRASVSGKIVTEFIMHRNSQNVVSAQLYGASGLCGIIDWWVGNTGINLQYADEKDGGRTSHFVPIADYDAKENLKVTIYYSIEDRTFSIWLNNKLAAENVYFCGGKDITHIYFYNGSSTCNATIDDFRFYYAKEEDSKAVDLDIAKLRAFFTPGELSEGMLYKSVELPTQGLHGSTISWESSIPEVFAPDGTLSRPAEGAYPSDPVVTMTATVTSGGVTKTKDFIFTVLRTGSGDKQVVETDVEALKLSAFLTATEPVDGYISSDLSLPSTGTFGSAISWSSSMPDLISNTGEIQYVPETGATSPEVVLTATISYGEYTMTKDIYVRVLPQEVDVLRSALPEIYETTYKDSFDNENQAVHWLLRDYGGTVGISQGAMKVTRREYNEIGTYATIYAHNAKAAQSGLVAFDFTMKKENGEGQGEIEFASSNTNRITRINWMPDNTFTVLYADSLGGGVKTLTTEAYTGEVRMTGLINSDTDTFTLWINEEIVLKDKYPEKGQEADLVSIRYMISGDNYFTWSVPEFHVFHARPYAHEQAAFDAKRITDEVLVPGGFVLPNTIDSDLVLPTEGYYGSTITWESNDTNLVDPSTGRLTRPLNASEFPKVTVTAVVSAGDYVTKKEFTYSVLTAFSEDSQYVAKDLDYLTFENYDIFAFDDYSFDGIRYSLRLPSKLAYGSRIMWSTDNDKVLTSSGRVIRPRWDEGEKQVTLTATISYGNATQTKDFALTILPDEELKDPGYMPDEEFFGVWDGNRWTQTGKFDYANNLGMAQIEAAAKAGDYETAKVELLNYMRNRPNSMLNISSTPRNTDYVENMALPGVWHYQSDRYYRGAYTLANHEFEQVTIPIRTSLINGGKNSFIIASKYNENSRMTIASKEHPNAAYHPKMQVVVDGQNFIFDVEADATMRAGQYAFTNYGSEPEMYVRMFGEFQGDDTETATLRFDLSALPSGTIESANLLLTAKLDEAYADKKEILIQEEASITWAENKATWGNIPKFIYNSNGVPGAMDWLRAYPQYCDSEFQQTHKFQNFGEVLKEYEYTKDEKYAYMLLYTMMDYIIDSQFTMHLTSWWSANGGYRWTDYVEHDISTNYTRTRRGAMPQLLITGFRLTNWIPIFERLLNSQYMTPDVCTTLMKNFWDCSNEGDKYLVDYALNLTPRANNQWVFEAESISKVALSIPEFSDGENWLSDMLDVLNHVRVGGYADDGAYGEAAQGYSESVLRSYIDYVITMKKAGRDLPDDFEDFLYNAVIYNETIARDSGGIGMSWGDAGWARSYGRVLGSYETISQDPTYLFLDSRGTEGVQPDWTSIHFPSNRVTAMRSDWSQTALHLFTDNNGIGGHGHPDDNAIRLSAYGSYLLIDPGFFSYENTIYRQYGRSTRAHNTVEVDDKSQAQVTDGMPNMQDSANFSGFTNEWSTNNQFDVLSQTSEGYEEVDHRRTITFLKSGFWIVSDLMLPNDENPHDYKQLWHTLPDTGLTLNRNKGTIATNRRGANIIMSSPDGVVTHSPAYDEENPTPNMGWFTLRWGMYEYAPYGYYAKDDVVGNTGFDTLLFPYSVQGQGAATTEDIDLGVPVEVATAMKISTTKDGQTSNTHYMLEYEPVAENIRTFGEFAGNGMVNVVRTDKDGNIQEMILNKGTVLKRADGTMLLSTGDTVANVGVIMRGNTAVVTVSGSQATGEVELNPEEISFYTNIDIDNVLLNDTYYQFTKDENGLFKLQNETTDEILNNDSSSDRGGITGVTSGGSQGGNQGGDIGGNTGGIITPQPEQPTFTDIIGHWAQESIERMAEKGVVKGDNGAFRPDDSVSRAELVTMVVRALNLTNDGLDTGFDDVEKGSWYAPYVKAALDAGIISADSLFRPNDKVTREEMAKILSGAHAILQKTTFTATEGKLTFADSDAVSDWAKGYVLYANQNGLMNGMDDNAFVPKANATRAQVATVIDRMYMEN